MVRPSERIKMDKKIAVTIMLGGQVSVEAEWNTSDEAGASIARMAIDDMVGYADLKSDEYNVTYEVCIRKDGHELLLKCGSYVTDVFVDGEQTESVCTVSDRFYVVSNFIGY